MGKNPSLAGHRESRGGVVLCEVMTPEELGLFHNGGTLPAERRCCLLCTRFNVHAGYMFARKQRGFPASLRMLGGKRCVRLLTRQARTAHVGG